MSIQPDIRTKVSYEAEIEKRAGKTVVFITKTTTSTPVSGRGREWNKQEEAKEVTILDLEDAEKLMQAITQGLFSAADPMAAYAEPTVADRGDEPNWGVYLTTSSGTTLLRGPYWSHTEAKIEAENYQKDSVLRGFDNSKQVVSVRTLDDVEHVVSVIPFDNVNERV